MGLRRFIINATILVIISLGPLAMYNLYMDTFVVFRKDYSGHKNVANQHYLKIKHLLDNKKMYDSYLFGSSKVGRTESYLFPYGKWYNMSYSKGVPLDHLNDLKLMLRKGVNVKNVHIGIDMLSYKINPYENYTQALWKPYPETPFEKIEFFVSYLLMKPVGKLFVQKKTERVFFDRYQTGVLFNPAIDANIEKNLEKHMNAAYFNEGWTTEGDRVKKTLNEIKEILELSEKHGFTCKIFLNPEHPKTYIGNGVDQFNKFKKGLVKLTDYWDFSGIDRVSTSNYYFYETLHYRPMVGQMMMEIMFDLEKKTAPADFGSYVTSDTIDEHIKRLNSDIDAYLSSQ